MSRLLREQKENGKIFKSAGPLCKWQNQTHPLIKARGKTTLTEDFAWVTHLCEWTWKTGREREPLRQNDFTSRGNGAPWCFLVNKQNSVYIQHISSKCTVWLYDMWTTRLSMQKLHSCSCLHDTSHITLARVLQQVLHYSQLFIVGIMWIISQDVQRDRSKYVGTHIPKDLNWSAITSSPLQTIQCLHFLQRLRATNPYHCIFTRSLQGLGSQGQQKRKPYMWFYKCPQSPSTPNTGCWP